MKIKNIFELAKNDFKSKYAGNFLGVLWAFLYPCVTVVLYWFVFRVILNSYAKDDVPYVLWLISAIVPYLFMCDVLPAAVSSFKDYSYLVKKVRFDVWSLPLIRLIAGFFIHIFFVALLCSVSCVLGYSPKILDLWLLYYMAAECVFLFVLSSCLAYISVFFRDIQQIVGIFIQAGYWATPLFWELTSIPLWIRRIITVINPISYVTEGFRNVMLNQSLSMPDLTDTVIFWCVTAIWASLAFMLHKRLKGRIADFV